MWTPIPDPAYPTLFFFETGEWWDYAMLIIVTFAYHAWRITKLRRNPFTQEVYSDTPDYVAMVRANATDDDQNRIAARIDSDAVTLGYRDHRLPATDS